MPFGAARRVTALVEELNARAISVRASSEAGWAGTDKTPAEASVLLSLVGERRLPGLEPARVVLGRLRRSISFNW